MFSLYVYSLASCSIPAEISLSIFSEGQVFRLNSVGKERQYLFWFHIFFRINLTGGFQAASYSIRERVMARCRGVGGGGGGGGVKHQYVIGPIKIYSLDFGIEKTA